MKNSIACMVFVCFSHVCFAGGDAARPTLICPFVEAGPTIDGDIKESQWASATHIANYMSLSGREFPQQQTEAYVCRDRSNLYFALRCHETQMQAVKANIRERDGNVYNDDCIEIFIDSGISRKHFYQLLINSLGTLQDIKFAEWSQPNWNSDANVAVSKDGKSWSVEIAIPLADIDLSDIQAGQHIGINLTRTVQRTGEHSCWSPTGSGSFHVPGRFGDLVFADRAGLSVELGDWSQMNREVEVEINRAVPNAVRIMIETVSEDGAKSQAIHEVEAEQFGKKLKLSYTLPPSWQDYLAQIEVCETSSDALLYRSPAMPLAGSHDAKLEQARMRIKQLEADIHLIKSDATESGYMVTPVSSFRFPSPDDLPVAAHNTSIALAATPGEYEPASCLIYTTKDLQNIKVSLDGDLVHHQDASERISPDHVDLRVVKWWFQGGRDSGYDRKTFVAELLVKNDRTVTADLTAKRNVMNFDGLPEDEPDLQPFDLAAYRNKQIWITVKIPQSSPQGIYQGVLRIAPENAPPTLVPIQVEVLPFKLVETQKIFNIYYYNPTNETGQTDWAMLSRELADMKAHGFNSTTILSYDLRMQDAGQDGWDLDLDTLSKEIACRVDAGMDGPVVLSFQTHKPPFPSSLYRGPWREDHVPNSIDAEKLAAIIQSVNAWAYENKAPAIYFYGIDEPNFDYTGRALDRCGELFKVITGAGGRTTTALDVVSTHKLGDLINLPIYNAHAAFTLFGRPASEKLQQQIELMYWHPLESSVHDRFHFGVMPWKANLDGVCPYAYRHVYKGGAYYDESFGMPSVSGARVNRNIMYTYPAKQGPIPTIQWEAAREGIDDLRYLETLNDYVTQIKNMDDGKRRSAVIQRAEQILSLQQFKADDYISLLEKLEANDFVELRSRVTASILEIQGLLEE